MNSKPSKDAYFGYQKVTSQEKTQRVTEVFESVAQRYDLMNDILSLGIHHLWKRFTIACSSVREGQTVLDLAGGSGDLTRLLASRVGPQGRVILADINEAMLNTGRRRLIDEGVMTQLSFLQANAEALPLADQSIDAIFIAFGLRNVTHQQEALNSMFRVCKPGGRIYILEFTLPTQPMIKSLYDWYSFQVLPKLGQWVAGDEESYRYLAESIRMHPHPDTMVNMLTQAGFEDARYTLLSAGIVALHTAYKY